MIEITKKTGNFGARLRLRHFILQPWKKIFHHPRSFRLPSSSLNQRLWYSPKRCEEVAWKMATSTTIYPPFNETPPNSDCPPWFLLFLFGGANHWNYSMKWKETPRKTWWCFSSVKHTKRPRTNKHRNSMSIKGVVPVKELEGMGHVEDEVLGKLWNNYTPQSLT